VKTGTTWGECLPEKKKSGGEVLKRLEGTARAFSRLRIHKIILKKKKRRLGRGGGPSREKALGHVKKMIWGGGGGGGGE